MLITLHSPPPHTVTIVHSTDYVTIYDGATTDAPQLAVIYGSYLPFYTYTSSTGGLLVTFTHADASEAPAFSAVLQRVQPSCSGVKTMTTGNAIAFTARA